MTKTKKPGKTAGKEGINPVPAADNQTVRVAAEQLTMVPIDDLNHEAAGAYRKRNTELHSRRRLGSGWIWRQRIYADRVRAAEQNLLHDGN